MLLRKKQRKQLLKTNKIPKWSLMLLAIFMVPGLACSGPDDVGGNGNGDPLMFACTNGTAVTSTADNMPTVAGEENCTSCDTNFTQTAVPGSSRMTCEPNNGGNGITNPDAGSVDISEDFRTHTIQLQGPISATSVINADEIRMMVVFTKPEGDDDTCDMVDANCADSSPTLVDDGEDVNNGTCICADIAPESVAINEDGQIVITISEENYTFTDTPLRFLIESNFLERSVTVGDSTGPIDYADADDPIAPVFIMQANLPSYENPEDGGLLPDFSFYINTGGAIITPGDGGEPTVIIPFIENMDAFSPLILPISSVLEILPHSRYGGNIYRVTEGLYSGDDCLPPPPAGEMLTDEHVETHIDQVNSDSNLGSYNDALRPLRLTLTQSSSLVFDSYIAGTTYYFINAAAASLMVGGMTVSRNVGARTHRPTATGLPISGCAVFDHRLEVQVITSD